MSKEGDSRFANVVAIAGVRSTEQSVFEQHQAAAGDSRFTNDCYDCGSAKHGAIGFLFLLKICRMEAVATCFHPFFLLC